MGIGDELMVTGHVRVLQQRDPRRVRIQYEKRLPRWCSLWDFNPRIARPEESGDFQVLNPRTNYLRPYCSGKTAERWTWVEHRPPVGEIYFKKHEEALGDLCAGKVVLGPVLKAGASPNKAWPVRSWQSLALLLSGLPMVTLGPVRTQLPGVEHMNVTIRESAAIIARARVVVTQEGALHHIAAAVGTPAVVIYGGYISPRVVGYDGQVDFFRGADLGCGMRVPCGHCSDAMASITPEEVAEATRKIAR